MTFISIIINCDTRSGFKDPETEQGAMFSGCRSVDFLLDGVRNKIKFFDGFDKEVIVFIDEHEMVPQEVLNELRMMVNTLVVRKHDKKYKDRIHFECFNDMNYLSALFMARGSLVCHFDQDTNAFARDKEAVQEMIDMLKDYAFISYPSHWSPRAVTDPSFGHRTWASTRFFICKKEALKFEELINCLEEPEWGYQKYGDSPRRCNWLEHFCSLVNNDSVYYPPMDLEKRAVFTWSKYKQGVLKQLNSMKYDEVKDWIASQGHIQYPVDIACL